jgi:TrmH family RNA methyltransferase
VRQGGAELRAAAPGRGLTAAFHDGLPVIRSRKNDRLRLVRSLSTRRGRRRQGRFLLEGPKVLQEALARDPKRVEQVLFRTDGGSKCAPTLAAARAAGVPCYPVDPALFDDLAPAERPQPLLAVAHATWSTLEAILGEAAPLPRAVAACVGVQDPGNLGTILRTARFLGLAGAVVLPGTQDPFSPKVARSSAGALLERPPAQADDVEALLAAADEAALTPVALVAHGGEVLGEAELPARSLLLLGAEGPGLDADLAARAGRRVRIASPAESAESLNVAVAFAIVAHAWSARWGGAAAP